MGRFSKSISLVIAVLLFPACAGSTQTGTLEGTVSIGPIWPVERPGEKPPVPPEVFQARKIMVYNKSRTKLIQELDIVQVDRSQEGRYRVELPPGVYVVDIKQLGIDHSGQVPKTVEVKAGQTVRLDIDIDTGIR